MTMAIPPPSPPCPCSCPCPCIPPSSPRASSPAPRPSASASASPQSARASSASCCRLRVEKSDDDEEEGCTCAGSPSASATSLCVKVVSVHRSSFVVQHSTKNRPRKRCGRASVRAEGMTEGRGAASMHAHAPTLKQEKKTKQLTYPPPQQPTTSVPATPPSPLLLSRFHFHSLQIQIQIHSLLPQTHPIRIRPAPLPPARTPGGGFARERGQVRKAVVVGGERKTLRGSKGGGGGRRGRRREAA
ncbi:hypothetical protein B0H11DRAFT_200052 [Mycena galericulata]|nr:hypothetical protein B0H11DRAFT_200052 [Mycena galericulata]